MTFVICVFAPLEGSGHSCRMIRFSGLLVRIRARVLAEEGCVAERLGHAVLNDVGSDGKLQLV
jgi:hypothetical protein